MSILHDEAIAQHARKSLLITEGFSEEHVKQACYELRASKKYFEMRDGTAVRKEATTYLLLPHSYLVVVTIEKLRMPNDMLGRILSKGHLFSLGVIPVNTYADPGFEGYLGITLFNGSDNVIRIQEGQPIAKIEFNRLAHPVARPYHGQHGLSLDVWPVPSHLLVKREELSAFGISGHYQTNRVYYGAKISELIDELDFYKRWIWVQITVTIVAMGALVWFHGEISLLGSLVVGVAGNLATSVLGLFARKLGIFQKL